MRRKVAIVTARAALVCLMVAGSTQATTLLNEDWSSWSYATNGWTVGSNNWTFASSTADPETSPYAEFNWNPVVYNYSNNLTSKVLLASGYDSLQLDYDVRFGGWSKSTLEQFAVQVYDGSVWHQLAQYNNQGGDRYGNFPWTHGSFDISAYASDDLRVRFIAFGVNSENITGWYVDSVKVSVPEPGTSMLAVLGLGLVRWGKRRFAR